MIEFNAFQVVKFHTKFSDIKGNGYTLAPYNRLLPFQIKRENSNDPIVIKYVNVDTLAEITIITATGDTHIFVFDGYDIIVNYAQSNISTVPEGEYYIKVESGNDEFWSEKIRVKQFSHSDLWKNDCRIIRFDFKSSCDIHCLFHRGQNYGGLEYIGTIYLEGEIIKPTYDKVYNYVSNGVDEVLESVRISKIYHIDTVLPDWAIDSYMVMTAHESVKIYTHEGFVSEINKFEVGDPEYLERNGHHARLQIDMIFETITRYNCCDSLDIPIISCISYAQTVRGVIPFNSIDYNNYTYNGVPLVDGDLVLINNTGVEPYEIRKYTNSPDMYGGLGIIFLPTGAVVFDEGVAGSPKYYFKDSTGFLSMPTITNVVTTTNPSIIQGNTFNTGIIEVYAWQNVGTTSSPLFDWVLVATGTGADYINTGLLFNADPTATKVKVIAKGVSGCLLAENTESEEYPITPPSLLEGISIMQIEGTGPDSFEVT